MISCRRGKNVHIGLHAREAGKAPSLQGYCSLFAAAKVTFSNGYRAKAPAMITARPFEAILAKCLVLEESSTKLDQLLTPFIHFVPVQNVYQAAAYASFFSDHEDYRSRIVNAAYSFHQQHYSYRHYWNGVFARLAAGPLL